MHRRLTETGWLEETEQVDSQSFNEMVLGEVHRRLGALVRRAGDPIRITDFGCGLGANRRRLSAVLAAPQHWRMVDFDAEVVAAFRKRFRTDTDPTTDVLLLQESEHATVTHLLDEADMIILSRRTLALPPTILQRLLDKAKADRIPIWAVLLPTGFVKFEPETSDDPRVHQMASPPEHEGAAALIRMMEQTGFRILQGESDWVVYGENDSFWHSKGRALQRAFLQRYLGAARRNHPDQAASLLGWANKRSVLIERKKTILTVGHTDVLAIPES